jgi:acyl-CoA synthetase (NDP forming)
VDDLNLQALLSPAGIAVVGASRTAGSPSRRALRQLRARGYAGGLSAVNPRYDEVDGVACFPSLRAVPHPVDLVLVFVSAARSASVIDEAGAVGCRAAVVFSSGFAEVGPDGTALQDELSAAALRAGVRVLGPNCQGVIHFPTALAATFTSAVTGGDLPSPGRFAYLGQSGAVGGSFFDLTRARGTVPRSWLSTGNQADLDVTTLARGLLDDPPELLCFYLEDVPPGPAWADLTASAAAAGVRLAVLRSGRSLVGRRAAASHTGALVGPDRAFEILCETRGVIVVDDVDQLVDLAVGLPSARAGRNLGIVTSSGGAGCLLADAADCCSLGVPELTAHTQKALQQLVPDFGAVGNPVDVTAQLFINRGAGFADICHLVASDPGVDQLVIILTMVVGSMAAEVAAAVADLAARLPVPLSAVYLAAHERTSEARSILGNAGIPVFDSASAAARTLARLNPAAADEGPAGPESPVPLVPDLAGGAVLTEAAGAALLDSAGIARPAGRLARSAAEAREIAAELSGPLVLKAQAPDLLHKTEHGGVRLGVLAEQAAEAYDDIVAALARSRPGLVLDGVLVQDQAGGGVELLVGVTRDRGDYPPVITVGMGGIAAELYADVASGLCPLGHRGALALLRRLKGYPLLTGFRGSAACDVGAAASAIAAASRLAVALGPELSELEVNPLIVHPDGSGATAADFLLVRSTGQVAG